MYDYSRFDAPNYQSGISDADITNFYLAHAGDAAAINAAMAQYGVSADRVTALTGWRSAQAEPAPVWVPPAPPPPPPLPAVVTVEATPAVSDAAIVSFYQTHAADPAAINAAMAQYGVSAERVAALTGWRSAQTEPAAQRVTLEQPPPPAVTTPTVSDADILNFYNAHAGDDAAIFAAMAQYGVSAQRLAALAGVQIAPDTSATVSDADILNFYKAHAGNDVAIITAMAQYGVSAEHIMALADVQTTPGAISDADIIDFYQAHAGDQQTIITAMAQHGISAQRIAALAGLQITPAANATISDADIVNFFRAHAGDDAAIFGAMAQYGVSAERILALASSSSQTPQQSPAAPITDTAIANFLQAHAGDEAAIAAAMTQHGVSADRVASVQKQLAIAQYWSQNRDDPAKIHAAMQENGISVNEAARALGMRSQALADYLNAGRIGVQTGGWDGELTYNYDLVTPSPMSEDELLQAPEYAQFLATIHPDMLDAAGRFKGPQAGVNYTYEGLTPEEIYLNAVGPQTVMVGGWDGTQELESYDTTQAALTQRASTLDVSWRAYVDHGNMLAQLAQIVAVAVAAYFTAGAVLQAFGTATATATAGGAALTGAEAAAAVAANTATWTTTSMVVSGAAAGAAGSLAGQSVGVITGQQGHIDWGGVAMGAVGGAVAGGVGSTNLFGNRIANAMGSSTITQAVGVATGAQDHFSLANVVSAGVSAGVSQGTTALFKGTNVSPVAASAIGSFTGSVVGTAVVNNGNVSSDQLINTFASSFINGVLNGSTAAPADNRGALNTSNQAADPEYYSTVTSTTATTFNNGTPIDVEYSADNTWPASTSTVTVTTTDNATFNVGDSDDDNDEAGSTDYGPKPVALGDGRFLYPDGRIGRLTVTAMPMVTGDVSEGTGSIQYDTLNHAGSERFDNAHVPVLWAGTAGEEIKPLARDVTATGYVYRYINGVLIDNTPSGGGATFVEQPLSPYTDLNLGAVDFMQERLTVLNSQGDTGPEATALADYFARRSQAGIGVELPSGVNDYANESVRLSNYATSPIEQWFAMSNEPASAHTAEEWWAAADNYKKYAGASFQPDAIYNGLWSKGAVQGTIDGNSTARIPNEVARVLIDAGTHADVGRALGNTMGTAAGNALGMVGRTPNVVSPAIGSGVSGSGGANSAPAAVELTFDKGTRTWTTPAGVDYGPGSVHGNRVQHVLDHAVPNPNKTTHSVFNVDRKEVLGLVDNAWLAKGNPLPNDPGAYVVPMGRVIGTAGETSIKIIVRPGTNKIITAYPFQ